jgi:ABC-type antimicrobial peptide transport system permease subunit
VGAGRLFASASSLTKLSRAWRAADDRPSLRRVFCLLSYPLADVRGQRPAGDELVERRWNRHGFRVGTLAESIAPRRFNLFLFGVFGGAALLLASIGVYGVIAYWIAQRTHEFGVRIALGADRRSIARIVIEQLTANSCEL